MIANATILRIDAITGLTGAGLDQLTPGGSMDARCLLAPATAGDVISGALESVNRGAVCWVKDSQLLPALRLAGYTLVTQSGPPARPPTYVFVAGQKLLIQQDATGSAQTLYRVVKVDRGGTGGMQMHKLTMVVD